MKIIVDEMPKEPKECLFSEKTVGMDKLYDCKFDNKLCCSDNLQKCPYLKREHRSIEFDIK